MIRAVGIGLPALLAGLLGCSSDDGTAVAPARDQRLISEICAPVDTVHCRGEADLLVYGCEGFRVRGDFLVAEFRQIVATVQPELMPGETALSIGIDSRPDCFRLPYDGQDLSAQTCLDRDSTGVCLGGRYFAFKRAEGDLRLWSVGEWSPPSTETADGSTRPSSTVLGRASAPADIEHLADRGEKVMPIAYLEIVTADVDAVCATYAAANGLRFGDPDAALGYARTAKLPGGGMIGVRAPLHETEEPVVRPYWLVDDIESALAAAVATGAEVAHPPLEIPDHGTFAIYIAGGIQHGLWQL